ncbi:MAG: hypothetical protein ACREJ9_06230 [Candidatus Rokuibacteriota bacterium]
MLSFIERHFSGDGVIEDPLQLYTMVATALLVCALLVGLDLRARRTGKSLFRRITLPPAVSRERQTLLAQATLRASAVLIPVLVIARVLHERLLPMQWFFGEDYGEDGLLENLTVLGFVVAAVLFAAAWRRRPAGATGRIFLAIAAASLLVAMEEVSWGQRIFGWSTPAEVVAVNVQSETNLHNLVDNDAVRIAYPIIGIGIFLVLWLSCILAIAAPGHRARAVLPPPSLVLLAAAIAVGAQNFFFQELVELLAAIFAGVFAAHVLAEADPRNQFAAADGRPPAAGPPCL